MSKRQISPESVIDCPLGELGLVDIDNRKAKTFRKKPATISMLPSRLVLYAMCPTKEQLKNKEFKVETEKRLEALLYEPGSPGRTYNLDSVALLTKLYELESDGLLRIIRTAGLDVIRLSNPEMTKEDCLESYYEQIG